MLTTLSSHRPERDLHSDHNSAPSTLLCFVSDEYEGYPPPSIPELIQTGVSLNTSMEFDNTFFDDIIAMTNHPSLPVSQAPRHALDQIQTIKDHVMPASALCTVLPLHAYHIPHYAARKIRLIP